MKILRVLIPVILILSNTCMLTGCWNYREIEKLAVVAGLAVDKSEEEGTYELTVEIVDIKGGKEAITGSKIASAKGETMFDTVRNMIALTGKRLYWSHTKLIIVGEDVAREGTLKIVDWFNRDSETREDTELLIVKEGKAKEIFKGEKKTEEVLSFELSEMLRSEKSLSKAPRMEIWEFINDLEGEGVSAFVPAIEMSKSDGGLSPRIYGGAIFKKDQLVGFADGEETKYILFAKNDIKGGVLVQNQKEKEEITPVTLEIFQSMTKIRPDMLNGNIQMKVDVKTTTAIDEIQGTRNYVEEEGKEKLEKDASQMLKTQVQDVIKKVQEEYGSDIFGFGARIREELPEVWKTLKPKWDKQFKTLQVSVDAKVRVKNSAMLSKPLEMGD